MHAHSEIGGPARPMPVLQRLRALRPRTLRGRGILALAAALAYSLAAVSYLTNLRGAMPDEVAALEQLHRYERALAKSEVAVSNATLEVQQAAVTPLGADPASSRTIALAIESALRALDDLEQHEPGAVRLSRAIARSQQALAAQPVRATWIDLRDTLRRVQEDIAIQRDAAALKRQDLNARYQQRYDEVTLRTFVLLAVGVGLFGAALVWFFTRLTRDIVRLQVRASEIVRGERQSPLRVERDDELGQLTRAVNRMADDLESRARQLELEDQRRAHQEKMATLGALAATVAHEINNPLMAIGGVAQELASAESSVSAQDAARRGKLLLGEVQRLATVTRRMADVTAPRDADLPWLDLHALLRPMLHFLRYDPRYRGITFELALDSQVPAVRALAEPVELVVMRLLNDMAAAAAQRVPRGARIAIRTRAAPLAAAGGSAVELVIGEPATGSPAGGAAYADDRTLKVCRAIVESLGGKLGLQRDAAGLCEVTLALPAADGKGAG